MSAARAYRTELRWLPRGRTHARHCAPMSCAAQMGLTQASPECVRLDEYLDLAVREQLHRIPDELMLMFHAAACGARHCGMRGGRSSGRCLELTNNVVTAVRHEIGKGVSR